MLVFKVLQRDGWTQPFINTDLSMERRCDVESDRCWFIKCYRGTDGQSLLLILISPWKEGVMLRVTDAGHDTLSPLGPTLSGSVIQFSFLFITIT